MRPTHEPTRPPTPDEIVAFFLDAYRQGAFPMADPTSWSKGCRRDSAIGWYSPDPRAIIPLEDDGLHVPGGLKRHVRKPPFAFTSDVCFERVIRACALPTPARGGPSGEWLNETLVNCYTLLHHRGHAHSIEAWGIQNNTQLGNDEREASSSTPTLMGGIYGVSIGAAFFAESMFSRPELGGTNASNLCLVRLWNHLRACGYRLLDVQIANPHTQRFGVVEVPREDYLERLAGAILKPDAWRPPE